MVGLRAVAYQSLAQLAWVDRDIFHCTTARHLNDGGDASPGRYRQCIEQLFFGVDRVGASRLQGIKTAEHERAAKSHLHAASASHHSSSPVMPSPREWRRAATKHAK